MTMDAAKKSFVAAIDPHLKPGPEPLSKPEGKKILKALTDVAPAVAAGFVKDILEGASAAASSAQAGKPPSAYDLAGQYRVTDGAQKLFSAYLASVQGADIVRPAGLSEPALIKRTVDFVRANASDDESALFPAVGSGNLGLVLHPLDNASAEKLMRYAKLMLSRDQAMQAFIFNPESQALFGVRVTEDENVLLLVVVDRKTGEAQRITENNLNPVDTQYTMKLADFLAVYPGQDLAYENGGEDVMRLLTGGSDGIMLYNDNPY